MQVIVSFDQIRSLGIGSATALQGLRVNAAGTLLEYYDLISMSIGSPDNGLSISSGVISLGLASGSTTGALNSTDWTTFNNKQSALVSGTNITISGGSVSLNASISINNATVSGVTNAGTLVFNGSTGTLGATGALSVPGAITTGGNLTVTGGGTLTTAGALTVANATHVNETVSGVSNLTTVVMAGTTGTLTAAGAMLTPGMGTHSALTISGTSNFQDTVTIRVSTSDVTSGRVAWYKFDGDVTDSSGNGYNGTATGSPTYSTGQIEQAITFPGSNSVYVTLPANILSSAVCTITFWMKPTATPAYARVVAFRTGDGDEMTVVWGSGVGTQKIQGNSWNASIISATNSVLLNAWSFVVMASNGTTTTMYVNGSYVGTNTTQFATPGVAAHIGTDLIFPFNGSIDDLRVYNRAITSGEVTTLYNNGVANYSQLKTDGTAVFTGNVTVGSLSNYGTSSFTGNVTLGANLVMSGGTVASLSTSLGTVTLTTGTTANVGSLSLAAGLWEIQGVVEYALTATTATDFKAGLNVTSATFGALGTYQQLPLSRTLITDILNQKAGWFRLDNRTAVSATPVYIIANSTFSAGSVVCTGFMRAQRVG